MAALGPGFGRRTGYVDALRRVRDPLLLLATPLGVGLLIVFVAYGNTWPIGFDFRGTLWEPARSLLDGTPIYPKPTREAVMVGNPTVYPPLFIVASVPLAFLPVAVASWLWFVVLAGSVVAAMWIVGVRDWRCHVIAVTSPVVVHGLYFGNLTIVLVLLVALAWRFRNEAPLAGGALGIAIAAKLFVAPLLVWLLLTRRFRAAAWCAATAVVLVLGAWAIVGGEGLRDYPALIRALQDVYATRSFSVSTVAGSLDASVTAAVLAAAIAGAACLAVATWLVRRADGDRRAFTAALTACVVGSPIVWPNYAALLFVPIAATWPRLAPAWFFGYAIWLAGLAPKAQAEEVCCRPPDVVEETWLSIHTQPLPWVASATIAIVAIVGGATAAVVRERSS